MTLSGNSGWLMASAWQEVDEWSASVSLLKRSLATRQLLKSAVALRFTVRTNTNILLNQEYYFGGRT